MSISQIELLTKLTGRLAHQLDIQTQQREFTASKTIDLLKENKLDHIANSMPDKISGGEKSRVLLIRVLLLETSVILLDEPFNGLDTETKFKTKDFFNKNLLKFNKIALMVTHNKDDVIDNKKILNL